MREYFRYNGVRYVTDTIPFDIDHIKLPDGTFVRIEMWLESHPPQIGGLTAVVPPPGLRYVHAVEAQQ
jgi:hypothetical protein